MPKHVVLPGWHMEVTIPRKKGDSVFYPFHTMQIYSRSRKVKFLRKFAEKERYAAAAKGAIAGHLTSVYVVEVLPQFRRLAIVSKETYHRRYLRKEGV